MADKFDELAKALGHLVLAFNDLEVALGGALMYLLKQDEEAGAAFTAHLGKLIPLSQARLYVVDAPV